MNIYKVVSIKSLKCLGIFVLTIAIIACGGGENTAGSAEVQSAESDSPMKQALGVPSGWVGRKPPTEAAKKIAELEASGALPRLDTSSSIAGPDLDRNGIRDDIDRHIEQLNYMSDVKASVQQQARVYQKVITTDLTSASAIEAAKNSGILANKCIIERFSTAYWGERGSWEAFQVTEKLKALTLNTKSRLLAWVAFDKKMNGQTFMSIPGEACE